MPVGHGLVSGWATSPVRQWAALKSCPNPNEDGKVGNGFELVSLLFGRPGESAGAAPGRRWRAT
jgi:hypothetical protein